MADGVEAFPGGLLGQLFLLQLADEVFVGFGLLSGLGDGFAERIGFKPGLAAFLAGVLDRTARFLESLLMFESLLTLGDGAFLFRLQREDWRGLFTGAWFASLGEIGLKTLFEQHAFLTGAIRADWSYWIPLLCLYEGLRVSEASQLYTNDVVAVDGVWCLSVISDASDDDEDGPPTRSSLNVARSADEFRRLKNPSSRRIVPIHPKLIELGFLEFVRRVTDSSPRAWHLFYGLKWEPKSMFGRKPSE